GIHSRRASPPERRSAAWRRSMKDVVAGNPVFKGFTFGRVAKNTRTARHAPASRARRSRRALRVFRRGSSGGAAEASSTSRLEIGLPLGLSALRVGEGPAQLPDAFLGLLARQRQGRTETDGGSAGG